MRRSVGLLLVVLGVVLAVATWWASGRSYAVLTSPSMEPWASPGDLLVHRPTSPDEIEVGDVVTVPAPGGGLVTHRVARTTTRDGMVVARLQADSNQLPDPVPVPLRAPVARVESVIPMLGSLLTRAPLLWGALALLLTGGAVLVAARRTAPEAAAASQPPERSRDAGPIGPPPVDPRLEALLATCEQLAEDGLPAPVLDDLVRVRTAIVLGLPPAERAGAVLDLDDGARFYVLAVADADPDALALVPVDSQRRRVASRALDTWWAAVGGRVPDHVRAEIAAWTAR